MEVVAVDIGGTHARFALAETADGRVHTLGTPVTMKTGEYASFQTAWQAFGEHLHRPLPPAAAIAFAGPVAGDVLQLTNSHWAIRPALICERLHVERYTLVNDFAAVAHAVAQAAPHDFCHLTGPDPPLPPTGVISIVGPGTGLGVAALLRHPDHYEVIATEGGHIDFAPIDVFEDGLLTTLRQRHRRASVERLVAGPGLRCLYDAFGRIEGKSAKTSDDRELWTRALDGTDSIAVAALDRFCMILGSVAGDIALAQGAGAVVIAGGLGARIADHLPSSGFAQRFAAKGRFETMMAGLPVKLITLAEPGLFGAAAAFAREHAQ